MSKDNIKVYLSGRMSGLPADTWRWRFSQKKVLLEWDRDDVTVVNPADTIISRHPWLYRLVGNPGLGGSTGGGQGNPH